LKIATWNVNSLRVRLPHVEAWLEEHQPDMLALQETKITDDQFPAETLTGAGYQVLFSGQKTYNGVAIISRTPGSDVVTELAGLDDPARRVLAATFGELRLINLYVPNGQRVDSEKYDYKMRWLEALHAQLARELARYEHVAVLGDFNIAPEDQDVHDPVAWEGDVLCSPRERSALSGLLELGFSDVFRLFEQPEQSYSWWDYRAAAFRRNNGLRIDLILASTALAARCIGSEIDVAPRRLERPSDHTPVLADFDMAVS
jgi:exodeoxyribonuclease-3